MNRPTFQPNTKGELAQAAASNPMNPMLLCILCLGATAPATAQISYVSRNGQNSVACGPPGAGIGVHHQFSTPSPTHDPIAVSDPGDDKRPASNASAGLDADFSPSSVRLANAGNAHRGALPTNGNGAYATADGRDECQFTLAAPTRFRLAVAIHAATTEGNSTQQSFGFLAFGPGMITLDDGTSGSLTHSQAASGDWTAMFKGTLRAGTYNLSLNGRTDGGNAYPFTGSYSNSLTLIVNYCDADFDGDGFVTGDDFDAYTAAFELGATAADFDGDGFVTGDDFDLFVLAFERGC